MKFYEKEIKEKIFKKLKIEKSVGKSTMPDKMMLIKRDNIIGVLNFKCSEAIQLTLKSCQKKHDEFIEKLEKKFYITDEDEITGAVPRTEIKKVLDKHKLAGDLK